MFDEIDFGKTDMDYIHSFYVSDMVESLMEMAGNDENLNNLKIKEGIEEAVYQLKAMSQNPYNNDCWRMLLYVLKLINDRYFDGEFETDIDV